MHHVVYHLIEDALRELADETVQTRLWLSTGPPEVSSFTEAVERLFTDSGLDLELERRHQDVFNADIDDRLRQFGTLLDSVDGHLRSPEEVLSDPIMERVRTTAQEILVQVALTDWSR